MRHRKYKRKYNPKRRRSSASRRRKHAGRHKRSVRRNKGRSGWLRHAASYLKRGLSLKAASKTWKKR